MSTNVSAGQEETTIGKTILDMAKSMTDFPRTREIQSVLKFYTKDYDSISDGKLLSINEIEKLLLDMEEQINLGNPVGISYKVTNIKVEASGNIGWATYDYLLKTGAGGQVMMEEQGNCTGIYKKKGTVWLIRHEHCSTQNRQNFLEKDAATEKK
jgi:ketosteroid isomerase-like protein